MIGYENFADVTFFEDQIYGYHTFCIGGGA
jgi:hypothetical protein